MKKIIYILLFGLGPLLFAQERNLDEITKDLYLTGDWQGLIYLSSKINNDHFTTYEIEYRLAVAYYNSGNYFDSAQQFEHIINTYHIKGDVLLEYLYYAYLFSGRQQDALLVARDFPFHQEVKTGVKKVKFIDFISAEGGIKLSDNKQNGIENLTYLNAGFGQQLGYRLKLQHAFTHLSQQYINLKYQQNEYYGNIHFQMGKGLTLIPSYHYVSIKKDEFQENTTYFNNNRMNPAENEEPVNNNDQYNTKTNIFHIAVKKQWNRFSISPSFVYIFTQSDQNNAYSKLQYGVHTGLTIKPTRDRLWLGAGIDFLNSDYENKMIWNIKAYYSLGTKAYIYLRYLSAGTSDFTLEDAMYYYNAVSTMSNNISTTIGFYFTPKMSWYVNYQYEINADYDYDLDFSYNTIITGIKIDL